MTLVTDRQDKERFVSVEWVDPPGDEGPQIEIKTGRSYHSDVASIRLPLADALAHAEGVIAEVRAAYEQALAE